MTNEQIAIRQFLSKTVPKTSCLGHRMEVDQDSAFSMLWTEKVNGVWYRIRKQKSDDGVSFSAEKI